MCEWVSENIHHILLGVSSKTKKGMMKNEEETFDVRACSYAGDQLRGLHE